MTEEHSGHAPRGDRPTLIFDGDCGFCRRAVAWLLLRTGDRVDAIAWQNFAFPAGRADLTPDACRTAVHLFDPRDGTVLRGAAACARAFATAPGRGFAWAAFRWIPGVAPLAALGYRWVARHRAGVSKLQRAVSGSDLAPATFVGGRRLFLALLGLAFGLLFVSLLDQRAAIFGSDGVEPIASLWDWGNEAYGPAVIAGTPTLFWLGTGDGAQLALLWSGIVASLALVVGVLPWLAVLVCGTVALSFSALFFAPPGAPSGSSFTGFDWEALLVECAFLGLFLAPGGLLPGERWRRAPSAAGMWLARLALVRVLFLEGLFRAGLAGGSWGDDGAFATHLATQPLPTGTALAIVHWHPAVLTAIGTALLAIELVAPWAMFLPRRVRWWGFVAIAVHEAFRFATGIVGVYPLAIVALAALNLDDRLLRRALPRSLAGRLEPSVAPRAAWLGPLRATAAVGVTLLGVLVAAERLDGDGRLHPIHAAVAPWQICNGYVPFAAVESQRLGLVLEVSPDRRRDVPVSFHQSTVDPLLPPPGPSLLVERLAWKWEVLADRLAAGLPEPAWVARLATGLLEGRAAIVARLRPDSLVGAFDDGPPQQLRIRGFRYLPAIPAARTTGPWWTREPLGLVGPSLELRDGALAPVTR